MQEGLTTLSLVGFRIGHWRFAVRLAQVKTSVMPSRVTPVWLMPGWVRGIISLHGSIVCVLDLGRLLGLPDDTARPARFMVLKDGALEAAIPVHEVFRVPEIPVDRVEPLPTTLGPAQRELLEGTINTASIDMTARGEAEDILTLIDTTTLFGSPIVRALGASAGAVR